MLVLHEKVDVRTLKHPHYQSLIFLSLKYSTILNIFLQHCKTFMIYSYLIDCSRNKFYRNARTDKKCIYVIKMHSKMFFKIKMACVLLIDILQDPNKSGCIAV